MRTQFLPILKNTAGNVIMRGAFGAARIVMLLLIARSFGATEFGKLSLVLAFVDIAKVVADLGLDIVTIRKFAAERFATERLLNNVLSAKIVLGFIVALASPFVFLHLYGKDAGSELLFIILPTLITSLLINAFSSYFQAQLAISRALTANIVGVCIYVGLTIIGLMHHAPLMMLVAAIPMSEAITLALLLIQYRKSHSIHLEFDLSYIGLLIRESYVVGISGIIVVLYSRMDNLLITHFLGANALGNYAVAYRVVEPFFLVFSSLSLSLYASLSSKWETNRPSEISETIRRVLFAELAFACLGVVLLSFVVKPLFQFFSQEYVRAGEVLVILAVLLIFKGINPQLTAILNSLQKFRTLTIISGLNLICCIVFCIVLIPRYGIIGAAASLVATEMINTCIQAYLVYGELRRIRT